MLPTPGAPEAAAVREMFDRIAPRYDLLNRLLSGRQDVRWRRRAVDMLRLQPRARILDLCTGTADLLIEVLRRDPRQCGIGIDFSSEMLARGTRKLRRRGLERRAALVAGDAMRLPLQDCSFDGALVGFGLRNLGSPLAGLQELRRVLRPGGGLVVLEFSTPGGPLGPAYRLYARLLLPRLAGVVSDRSAYAYLPASVARFPDPPGLADLMREAGLEQVRWQSLTGGVACLHRGEKA